MKVVILAVCVVFSTACTASKPVLVKKETTKPVNAPVKVFTKTTLSKNQTSIEYIELFKRIAIEEMVKSGIPASITLAQGLLESASGNSTLAIEANNHFGIKCNVGWTGQTILHDDDAAAECFRVYENAEQSYRDHTEFLKRARYASLFLLQRNDYKGWAVGLKQAGYATNPKYADLLIDLIERYELDQYDREERTEMAQVKREEKILAEISSEVPAKRLEAPEKAALTMKIYEVKSGDTLYSIGRRFNLSVDDVKILNSLNNNELKLGQLLLVSK